MGGATAPADSSMPAGVPEARNHTKGSKHRLFLSHSLSLSLSLPPSIYIYIYLYIYTYDLGFRRDEGVGTGLTGLRGLGFRASNC